jgi:hypothetical protein
MKYSKSSMFSKKVDKIMQTDVCRHSGVRGKGLISFIKNPIKTNQQVNKQLLALGANRPINT